jgi:hypothetical protein
MGVRQSSSTKRDNRVSPHTEELSDAELARRACLQSKEAWDILYLRHWDFLYWQASQRLGLPSELSGSRRTPMRGNREDEKEEDLRSRKGVPYGRAFSLRVQDITVEQFVSEVYIQIWEKRKLCSYEERAEFRWWYAVVVKNILEDLRRQQRRSGPSGQRVPLVWEDEE